jgi:CRP-like cAMP-binding protein
MHLDEIARVIQLSIAPVFLITGIAGLLGVLSSRLGRTIDRARVLAKQEDVKRYHEELTILSRRAKIIYRAITLSTTSALLVCFVIASLFISAFVRFPVSTVVAVLFIGAMLSLIAALLFFLREVFLATRSLRIGPA